MARSDRDTVAAGGMPAAECEVCERLAAHLTHLETANPFAALDLEPTATPSDIRARFLALTKKYHPSRYARMHRDVVRLANEVFLRIKDAYIALNDAKTRERLAAELAPAAPIAPAPDATEPAEPSKATRRAATSAGLGPSASARKPAVTGRAAASSAPARVGSTRSDATSTTSLRARTLSGTGSKRLVGGKARAGSATGSAKAVAPGTPARPPPAGKGKSPGPRDRVPTDANALASTLHDTLRKRNASYEKALRLISQGDYGPAREILQQVAVDDPKTKKYRVQLHYAWGLEHEDAGRFEDARAELQRAVNADPTFRRAHEALDKLSSKKGFFSKLFGR